MVDTEEEQTFHSLLEDCIRVAINLNNDDFQDDDVLGLCTGNHKETCVPYIAGLFLGIKIVAFDTSISIQDNVYLLRKITPKVIFVEQNKLTDVEESMHLADVSIKLVVIGDDAHDNTLFSDYLDASEEDVSNFEPVSLKSNKETAAILFSSGTTGLPKGICLSHYGLLNQSLLFTFSGLYGSSRQPVSMSFGQLYWISSVIFLMSTTLSGIARVIKETYEADKVWKIIEKYKVNLIFLSPFQCLDLNRSSKPEDVNTSSLYVLGCGGGPLSEKLNSSLRDLLPGTFILQIYGQTEVAGASTMFQMRKVDEQLLSYYRPNSVGRPVPGFWFKVRR
ncbi:hypothetical protein HHI36_019854 [Cryptolaemus montrouzieri]|uniref:AMP-dependent synthetase/ligase domain-containing protein n=1 Tax=Cryptolaemus montrouzieri TaxID=559131 RepID=A0ABD2N9B1_9CUCU